MDWTGVLALRPVLLPLLVLPDPDADEDVAEDEADEDKEREFGGWGWKVEVPQESEDGAGGTEVLVMHDSITFQLLCCPALSFSLLWTDTGFRIIITII